ncbi:MAG: hypothetical protein ACK5AU_06490 [Flavobacteriales bacterium]|jgi:hypothetical protein
MREELLGPKVEGISLALVELPIEGAEPEYVVYMLSSREDIIEGIIVTSTGYGLDAMGQEIKTSTLRKGIEVMLPNEAARIEPLMPDLFGLNNEFWVSFWADDVMYDKRFVFEANTIHPKKFVAIPQLKAKGIIID